MNSAFRLGSVKKVEWGRRSKVKTQSKCGSGRERRRNAVGSRRWGVSRRKMTSPWKQGGVSEGLSHAFRGAWCDLRKVR